MEQDAYRNLALIRRIDCVIHHVVSGFKGRQEAEGVIECAINVSLLKKSKQGGCNGYGNGE